MAHSSTKKKQARLEPKNLGLDGYATVGIIKGKLDNAHNANYSWEQEYGKCVAGAVT